MLPRRTAAVHRAPLIKISISHVVSGPVDVGRMLYANSAIRERQRAQHLRGPGLSALRLDAYLLRRAATQLAPRTASARSTAPGREGWTSQVLDVRWMSRPAAQELGLVHL